MNTITIISAFLLLSSLVVGQEAYAPAEFSEPQWRQERQAGGSQVETRADNWLTKLLRGGWWTWDR